MRKIVLVTLLSAVAALGLHSLCLAHSPPEIVTSWELHAFVDVDGERKLDKKILLTPFTDVQACVRYAVTLPMPAPTEVIDGHTIVHGYICQRVDAEGIRT
jgi:hypothetical protein